MSAPLREPVDAAARNEALDLEQHVLVMAPAGSGKTGLLVARLLLALATADEPEQVVAITFTNKAAAEIRHRAIGLLARVRDGGVGDAQGFEATALRAAERALARDAQRGWQLLDQPERLRATTIDAFCAQLAAQLPLLSGLGGRIAVAEDAEPLYVDAVLRLVAELEDRDLDDADRDALRIVLRLADNRVDRLLPPLCELLASREQWLESAVGSGHDTEAAAQLLGALVREGLLTFDAALDADARNELAGLLREGAAVSEQLAWAANLDGWPPADPAQLARYRQLAAQLLTRDGKLRSPKGLRVTNGFEAKRAHTLRMKALLGALEGDERLAAATGALLRLPDPDYPASLLELQRALLRLMRRLAAHLNVIFGERGQVDFAQITQSALAALRPGGDYGDALLAADRRIRHLLVDEMQDTSETQVRLLEQLTLGWQPGDGRSLFLVGDPQQSIYAFRKAEVRLFLRMWQQRCLGELPLRCLELKANFRSRPAVVDWFNRAFTAIFPREEDPERGSVAFRASTPQREAADDSGVDVLAFAATEDERAANQAAEDAQRLIGSGSGSVAILARARPHLEAVIRALRTRGLTPACQDIDPLAAQPAVRDYIALALALWHPQDRLHWAVLLRAPFVGLSWADLVAVSRGMVDTPWPARIAARAEDVALSAEGRARLRRLRDALEHSAQSPSLRADLAERTEAVWYALDAPACLHPGELADVRAAMQLLRAQARDGGIGDLPGLQRALQRLYAQPRAGQVQVMTVHKSKGLEFDHVLLVGAHRRARGESRPLWHLHKLQLSGAAGELLVPRPPESLSEDDPAHRLYDYLHDLHCRARDFETLRLLYVAVTRARHSLRLYVCADRDDDGAPRFGSGSFAALLAPAIAEGLRPPASGDAPGEAVPTTPATTASPPPPRAPRLPLDVAALPADDALPRPQETRTLRPSEGVLNAAEDKREGRAADDARGLAGDGDLEAQLIGTLYHQALERIAESGIEAWNARAYRHALAAGFQRQGLPAPRVNAAVERVLELVQRTLDSDTGRWLLAPKPWARNEYHLAGYLDGRWVAAVIDRCFEDEDGSLWLVDYKAAARGVDAAALAQYREDTRTRYAEQLRLYAGLLALLRPDRRIRSALYLAETASLLELQDAPA